MKYEDLGTWTCGAGLDDGQEHIDFIQFEVEGAFITNYFRIRMRVTTACNIVCFFTLSLFMAALLVLKLNNLLSKVAKLSIAVNGSRKLC